MIPVNPPYSLNVPDLTDMTSQLSICKRHLRDQQMGRCNCVRVYRRGVFQTQNPLD